MEHWDRLWPGGYTFAYADGLFRPSTDTFLLGAFPRLRRGMTVCDLGAGTGLLGLLLLAREPELTVTGVELQPAACGIFRRTAAETAWRTGCGAWRGTCGTRGCCRRDGSGWRCPTHRISRRGPEPLPRTPPGAPPGRRRTAPFPSCAPPRPGP